jgi:hypothetical protein
MTRTPWAGRASWIHPSPVGTTVERVGSIGAMPTGIQGNRLFSILKLATQENQKIKAESRDG